MTEPTPGRVDAARVEVFQDEAGDWRWEARDTNGEPVADSADDGYAERATAEQAARDLFPNADFGDAPFGD